MKTALKTIAFFTLATMAAAAAAVDCSTSFCEQQLADDYLLRYKLNEPDDTISMELIYDGDAWLGIAFGESMSGSTGVIGSSSSIPQKYRLLAPTLPVDSAIQLMKDKKQTLIDASCEFTNGQTVMKFTKILNEENEIKISIGDNSLLWAYGSSPSFGYHEKRDKFTLSLESTAESNSNTAFPSASPGESTTSAGGTESATIEDCPLDFCVPITDGQLAYTVNGADGTITMEVTHDGDAWVAIGFSENGLMAGSDAVIGSTELGVPQKYQLNSSSDYSNSAIQLMPAEEQTLTDASVEFKDGQTVMRFTKIMNEPNQVEITSGDNKFLWAYGSSPAIGYHGANKLAFIVNLSSGSSEEQAGPNMKAWLAHGICAFIAWGVLVPTAVQSAIMRALFKGPLWFKLHRIFNATAFALTIAVFAIGVTVTSKGDGVHFSNSHERMGLAMFILVTVQVVGGVLRPHLPTPNSGEKKTTVRKGWEYGHRLAGVALLACGFWQMDSGIKLYANKFNGVGTIEEEAVTTAYWVWIGFECATLIIGGIYFKFLRPDGEKDTKAKGEKDTKAKDLEEEDPWVEDTPTRPNPSHLSATELSIEVDA